MNKSLKRQQFTVVKPGSVRSLTLTENHISLTTDNQLLIKVRAIGLNYADIFAILGLYSATPRAPFVPGLEYAGDVIESRHPGFKEGDRVYGVTKFGGYATTLHADPDYTFKIPPEWTYEEAAAFPVQTLTAYYALVPLGNLQSGQTILIHSAAGGVGVQANRIAKKFNAYTIGVVGKENKLGVLAREGFDDGILRDKSFKKNLLRALAGRELHLVLEATGGKLFRQSYDALAPMGRVVSYGSATFTPQSHKPNYVVLAWKYLFRPRVDPLSMITANKSVMAFNLIWLYEKRTLLSSLMKEIEDLILPAPYVGHTFSFEQLPDAVAFLKSGNSTGKVVVSV